MKTIQYFPRCITKLKVFFVVFWLHELQPASCACSIGPDRQVSSKRQKLLRGGSIEQLRPRSIMEETEQGWLKKT